MSGQTPLQAPAEPLLRPVRANLPTRRFPRIPQHHRALAEPAEARLLQEWAEQAEVRLLQEWAEPAEARRLQEWAEREEVLRPQVHRVLEDHHVEIQDALRDSFVWFRYVEKCWVRSVIMRLQEPKRFVLLERNALRNSIQFAPRFLQVRRLLAWAVVRLRLHFAWMCRARVSIYPRAFALGAIPASPRIPGAARIPISMEAY